jgi:hypothetical protein
MRPWIFMCWVYFLKGMISTVYIPVGFEAEQYSIFWMTRWQKLILIEDCIIKKQAQTDD